MQSAGYVSAASEASQASQLCGRGTRDLIGQAKGAAWRAADANATSTFTLRSKALLKCVIGTRRPVVYNALRSNVLSAEQLVWVTQGLHPDLVR